VNTPVRIKFHSQVLNIVSKLQETFHPRDLAVRKSSFPYLSSDTYFDLCDAHVTNIETLNSFIKNKNLNIERLYIIGELVENLISSLENIELLNLKSIVIMESDTTQYAERLSVLLKISNKIFSNNLVGRYENIFPIPLGIERQAYRSAGRLKDFKRERSIDLNSRSINFFIAWNDKTNPKRKTYKDFFRTVEKTLVLDSRLNARTIHKIMRKSKFVPSPAGNGFDCHRTWEAIYLGCVPVVLKSEFCGDSNWPVFVVNEWNDLLKYSQAELGDLYNQYKCNLEESLKFSTRILNEIKSA
jgi:hypothetical protein